MSGGNFMTAAAEYPDHMTVMHKDWLAGIDIDGATYTFGSNNINVKDEMWRASTKEGTVPGASPFNSVTAYDPGPNIVIMRDRHMIPITDASHGVDPGMDMQTYVENAIQKVFDIHQPLEGEYTDLDRRLRNLESAVAEVSPSADVQSYIDDLVAKIDATLFSNTVVTNAVTAFENRGKDAFLRQVSQAASGMFDIRAVMSTQFGLTMAAMEHNRAMEVNNFEQMIRLRHHELRANLVPQLTNLITTLVEIKTRSDQSGTGLELDAARMKHELDRALGQQRNDAVLAMLSEQTKLIQTKLMAMMDAARINVDQARFISVARQDEIDWNLKVEERDALWDLELFTYANQVMGSISGAAAIRQPSQFERLLQVAQVGTSALTGLGSLALGIASASDRRVKQDIQPLEGALDKLLQLHAYTYRYKPEIIADCGNPSIMEGEQVGLMAQEVEQVFPQWVLEFDGIKCVAPKGFEGVAVEAFRELTEKIAALEERVRVLEAGSDGG
jgi:hypothetical protein